MRVFAVYDVLTGAVVSKLCGHDACVRDVSWHPYEDNIVSSSVSAKLHTPLLQAGTALRCFLWRWASSGVPCIIL